MGRSGAKKNQKSGNLTDGLKKKDLKLTVIFAPVSRSELFDIYNPLECPVVDRQMRVISRLVDSSGEYSPETQDKVIYINCASAKCYAEEGGPIVDLTPESLEDKLGRAIQLIHELLDYWHGYYGTVFTTFCCFQPLEGLMTALQTLLQCPPFISNSEHGVGVSMGVPAKYQDAFDLYYEWTFVAKHSSVYKAEFKYEVYNEKSPEENLQEEIDDLLKELGEKDPRAREKFENYLNSAGTFRTSTRLGLEEFLRYHPEYQPYWNRIDSNRNQIQAIQEKNKREAEEWSHKSEAQRRGKVKRQLDKYYDDKIKKTQEKNDPFMKELSEKRKQLAYQQGQTSQYHPDDAQRAYDAYDVGVEYHGETHSRDTIEYEGEYYTMDELDKMYNALKYQKDILEKQKKEAWNKALDDIHKQVYMETLEAGLAIFSIVSIILTPLVLVDIIVIVGKMFTVEGYAKDWHNWMALGLDIFALVPFVGAAFKAGGVAGKVSHVAVSETIVKDVVGDVSGDLLAAANKERAIAGNLTSQAAKAEQRGNKLWDAGMAAKDAGKSAKGDRLMNQASDSWGKANKLSGDAMTHQGSALGKEAAADAAMKNNQVANQILSDGVSTVVPSAEGFVGTLPVVSLGGYVNDLALYIKNFSQLSGVAKATAGGNLLVQTAGHYGNAKTLKDNLFTLTSGPSYDVQQSGDDFVLVRKN